MDKDILQEQIKKALTALAQAGNLEEGAQVVVGCSTSEVAGGHIGKNSVPECGEWIVEAVLETCKKLKLIPVFQCCEHLNRALVLPEDACREKGYQKVCAVPVPKAGGSLAAAAWKQLEHPCLAASVQCEAGMDIGDTLIGMHLKPVAVPLRVDGLTHIGHAHLTLAFTRPPYIGGERAVYHE